MRCHAWCLHTAAHEVEATAAAGTSPVMSEEGVSRGRVSKGIKLHTSRPQYTEAGLDKVLRSGNEVHTHLAVCYRSDLS